MIVLELVNQYLVTLENNVLECLVSGACEPLLKQLLTSRLLLVLQAALHERSLRFSMSLVSAVLEFAAINLEQSGGFGPPKLINLVVWRFHTIRRVIDLLHLGLLNTLNAGHSLVIILASSFFWARNHKALVVLLIARLSWNCFRRLSWTIAVFRLRFFQLLRQMRIVIIILPMFHRCNDNEQVLCNLVYPALH